MKPVVASGRPIAEKFVLTLIIAVCVSFHACKKTGGPRVPPPPDVPTTRVGMLKEIVAQSVPSPLFHFDYTDSGRATGINFASGFFIYELVWVNGRLDRMINTFNLHALIYAYSNGRISSIREVRPDNTTAWSYEFDFNDNNQVSEIRWRRISLNGLDSFVYRRVLLTYRTDGNMARYIDHRNLTGQEEWVQTVEYTNFDNMKNVDDFALMKEFDDNVLYLPGIKLMVNNPRNLLSTGPQNDYEITYTFQYANGVPVSKQTKVIQVRGNQAGHPVVSNTSYSYY